MTRAMLVWVVMWTIAVAGTVPALAEEQPARGLVLSEVVPTWNPGRPSEFTRARVSAVGPNNVGFFTDARAGYQIRMKGIQVMGGSYVLFPAESDKVSELLSTSATHIYCGATNEAVHLWGCEFASDPSYPLVFKATRDGYTYLCGRGTVKKKDGIVFRLGYDDSADRWLTRVTSANQLDREAAVEALGWLAKTPDETGKATEELIEALTDSEMEVRRNAAEALGRLGDTGALGALSALMDKEKEQDAWVREVAEESADLIQIKSAARKLPDKAALAVLVGGLRSKWDVVRRTATDFLEKGGTDAVQALTPALEDEDWQVRRQAAILLGNMGDKAAVGALRNALTNETNASTKAAMEEAITKLER
jgi:hypothetical protein